nr:MAG TPA: hypothetical protein [Caudoviricetes sp.]
MKEFDMLYSRKSCCISCCIVLHNSVKTSIRITFFAKTKHRQIQCLSVFVGFSDEIKKCTRRELNSFTIS